MASVRPTPASLPPVPLEGLDPTWSRLVDAEGHTWHVLERHATGTPSLTVLAVHGNPTWSYLWRRLLERAPASWRVIAVDQLGMGFSERTGSTRRLQQRIDDLDALTRTLQVRGPVVTVAHDWGGPVSLGWVLRHLEAGADPHVVGVVLANTAVHQPSGDEAPALIRLARWAPLRTAVTRRTPVFTRGTTALSALRGRRIPRAVQQAFAAPYRGADRRMAIADFVADIPLEAEHPSAGTLHDIAEGVRSLDVPVMLAWGADDPVFSDRYLRDLLERMPHADVHRYERAGHLVTEDAPESIGDIITWITARGETPADTRPPAVPTGGAWGVARQDDSIALADMRSGRRITFAQLASRVARIGAGLQRAGVRPGDRVALLIPPGPDLIAVVYACWRIGAAVVVADSGLGLSGMRRAIRGAAPEHVIGIAAGLAVTRDLHLPGLRILVGSAAGSRLLGIDATLVDIARRGAEADSRASDPGEPQASTSSTGDPVLLVAFTSGSTGPAKGVVYTRSRLIALVDAIRTAYDIEQERDALVAAFAPWSVLGPALGIPSAIPDMDPTDPSTLTMASFVDAADAVGGTIAWTSPTGLRALIATAGQTSRRPERLRLLMIAGAPVAPESLAEVAGHLPGTRVATPYGMTEALPLTEVDVQEVLDVGPGPGVLVGRPLAGVEVRIAALDDLGRPSAVAEGRPGVLGEVVVRAPWMKATYDRRWATQHRSDLGGWHRTGDVGQLDDQGRVWIEGRLAHVITTVDGPRTPVAAELAAAAAAGTDLAACVGVGPSGVQVAVIVLPGGGRRMSVADMEVTDRVREAVRERCGVEIVAVLRIDALPVDIRHRSKIDRTGLARRAARLLAGSAAGADSHG